MPTTYQLQFDKDALREWATLDGSVKTTLKKLLRKRLEQPHVPGDALHRELKGYYKIKLRKQGYRLIYAVKDDVLVVMVVAVGKREDDEVYKAAVKRAKS
jgi:mRNA interferase RelE/StbE